MRAIRSCNVCVVGGAGFIGSHLVDYLVRFYGCKVLVIDNLVTGHRKFVRPEARFEHYDITGSEDHLRKLFEHHSIEYVFNYAAEPYIPTSFARPIYVFNVNAFGALKVINAAQEAGCKGVLQVSSAEIYGDLSGRINEQAPVSPHSTYGASKLAIDALVQARWRESQTPVIALRQFNCVGERETHPYVVPEIISQLVHNGQIIRLGNNSFRDFLYAGEAVRMAIELLENGEFGQVYNMGSEVGAKIYDLAHLLADILGVKPLTIEEDASRQRPWEIWHLQSDNSKLYSTIKYRPSMPLREALERTVQYYVDNGNRWDWETAKGISWNPIKS